MRKQLLTRDDILRYLGLLNDRLSKRNISARIILCGGAYLSLVHSSRDVTDDIDAALKPKGPIYAEAAAIAREYDLPGDWINNDAEQFMGVNMETYEYLRLSHLSVEVPDAGFILAMKCLTTRIDYSEDLNDITFLIDLLKLRSSDQLQKIFKYHYPDADIEPPVLRHIKNVLGE